MSSMRQNPLTCSGHTRPVVHLAFSSITPDGYFLISASKDGKPMLRQGETGDWVGTFEGHKGAVWSASLDEMAYKAATGSADYTAKLWNAVTGLEEYSFLHKHIVKSVQLSQDGTKLLTGSFEKILRLYDLGKPETEPDVFSGHNSSIKNALFTEDHKKIISIADDKTLRLWDVQNKSEIRKLELASVVNDIELSTDATVLSIAFGNKVAFVDPYKFEIIKQFELASSINTVSLHPSKNVFVCGGDDFKIYKCDYSSGLELESFKGHFGSVHCVRYSPDGELYASGSEDGTLRLWQNNIGKTYGLWKCVDAQDTEIEAA